MRRKIILFELNEVPWRVVDEYCALQPQSTLSQRLARCTQFETVTEDAGHLSPWTTWPSLHRGVPDTRHEITSFGQDLNAVDADFPPLWSLLARQGLNVGVCGSLHSYTAAAEMERYAFYLPDTFAAGSECFPQRLSTFQQFNLAMVQDSARNVGRRIPWQSAWRLLREAPGLGLTAATLCDVAGQLAVERMRPQRRVRRRTYQALLAFDIFFKQLSNTQPDFATFFTNHVASAMHRYWAARFPRDYDQIGYDAGWLGCYRHEIDFAMSRFDSCLRRLMAFVERHPEYQLWIATSMGQAATRANPIERQLYLTDVERFMRRLGIPAETWTRRPAMAPQVNVVVDESWLPAFRERLGRIVVDGRPVRFAEKGHGLVSMTWGQPDLHRRPFMITVDGQPVACDELGLANVEIEDRSNTTAYHIPQGMLLTFDPRARQQPAARTQISTLDVAPAIVRQFGLPVPGYMRSRGRLAA